MFKVPLDGGPLTNFYNCDPNAEGPPAGGLILGRDGKFYGVTRGGNSYAALGTVYSVTSNGVFTILAVFTNETAAYWPYDRLVQGDDGSLYGAAQDGGDGVIFRVTPDGALTAFQFPFYDGTDGLNGGLVQGNDGNFYGTTVQGGDGDNGIAFSVTAQGGFTMVLWQLYGWNPGAGLTAGSDGNLYGVCELGGEEGSGTIFRINMPGPWLNSVQTSNQLVLSWRTNYLGYTLQTSTDLNAWTSCTNAPTTIGVQYVVTNPISGPAAFFRLSKNPPPPRSIILTGPPHGINISRR